MEKRALHDILCGVLRSPFPDGEDHCYFEPPNNIEMLYPCIIYSHTNDRDTYADNIKYNRTKRYTVTVIDEDADSPIAERLSELPYCSSDRNYTADGLKHYVYVLYYDGPRYKEEYKNE